MSEELISSPVNRRTIQRMKEQQDPIENDYDRMNEKEQEVLGLIENYGWIDGSHHKQWVLDQIARVLTGDKYPQWVAEQKEGEDGPDTYEWDEGIAP